MIPFRGRNGAVVADKLFTERVEVGGAQAGLHMRFQKFQGSGCEDGTLPDAFDLFRGFNPDGHAAKRIAQFR